MLDQINEGSTSWLTMSFFDRYGAPKQPTTGTYKIDDLKSSIAIKVPTVFTPGSVTHIVKITPNENRIISSKPLEDRMVTVEWSDGTDTRTDKYRYQVVNLKKYPM
jgi:hypothetical protein